MYILNSGMMGLTLQRIYPDGRLGGDTTAVIDVENIIPERYQLNLSCYPNPFNNSTVISFNLGKQSDVSLDIYNVLWQNVTCLHKGTLSAGHHNFLWTGGAGPSGVYFYKLTTGYCTEIGKMTLLK
jgi:hypothetical protein